MRNSKRFETLQIDANFTSIVRISNGKEIARLGIATEAEPTERLELTADIIAAYDRFFDKMKKRMYE